MAGIVGASREMAREMGVVTTERNEVRCAKVSYAAARCRCGLAVEATCLACVLVSIRGDKECRRKLGCDG